MMFNILKRKLVNWCLSKKTVKIGEFHAENSPILTNIVDENDKLKFIERTRLEDVFVESTDGYAPIKHSFKTVKFQKYELILENGLSLSCADTHIVMLSGYVEAFVKDLTPGDEVLTVLGTSKVKRVVIHSSFENMFDLELADDKHLFYTNGILSHNTQTISMYLLWLSMFATKDDPKFTLIASKNNGHAMEIMNRIRYTYEELEHWLKPGVTFYNKHEIVFDNDSKISSEATTENTGRGLSISKLFIDELAFVNPRIQEEMWASLAPTLSTGGGFILSSTPNGDTELFAQLWRGANSGTNPFKPVRIDWHEHPERDETYVEDMRSKIGELKLRQEVFNEFISSDSLLISSLALQQIKPVEPLYESNGFKFWKKINPQCAYYMGVDIASGIGSDFSTIEVIEFPSLEQVAEFRQNGLNINAFYMKVRWLLRYLTDPYNSDVNELPQGANNIRKNDRVFSSALNHYNRQQKVEKIKPEVYWSFENNGLGHAFIALIQNDENFPEDAELITSPGQIMGVNTSSKTKLMAGLELKRLTEKTSGGLKLYSRDLIFELSNLISNNKGTFHAKPGATDDCVSALLVVMQVFKNTASHDESLYHVMYDYTEDNETAFGEDVDYEPPQMLF